MYVVQGRKPHFFQNIGIRTPDTGNSNIEISSDFLRVPQGYRKILDLKFGEFKADLKFRRIKRLLIYRRNKLEVLVILTANIPK